MTLKEEISVRRIVLIALLATSTQVTAQTRAPAGPAPAVGTCSRLVSTYDGVSKDLAANVAEGLGDNSAPRATLRAIEDSNSLTQAHIALDLMRDYHCPLPKDAPDSAYYLSPALTCATDRLKARGSDSPESCDRSKWQRAGS